MKKFIKVVIIVSMLVLSILTLTSCNEAEKVSENLSQEADNFNCFREVTVIDCITGDVLFKMQGRLSITADTADRQLEIVVEYKDGLYKKHFIGLSDNVTYIVEDMNVKNVSKYQYELNFNPKMWIPVKPKYVD